MLTKMQLCTVLCDCSSSLCGKLHVEQSFSQPKNPLYLEKIGVLKLGLTFLTDRPFRKDQS